MSKFCDFNGDEIDLSIPTYQENIDTSEVRVDTAEDLELVAKHLVGHDSLDEFCHEYGVTTDELLGKWWIIVGGRMFVNDGTLY